MEVTNQYRCDRELLRVVVERSIFAILELKFTNSGDSSAVYHARDAYLRLLHLGEKYGGISNRNKKKKSDSPSGWASICDVDIDIAGFYLLAELRWLSDALVCEIASWLFGYLLQARNPYSLPKRSLAISIGFSL